MTRFGSSLVSLAAAVIVVATLGTVVLLYQPDDQTPTPAPQAQVKLNEQPPAPDPNVSPPAPEPAIPVTNTNIENLLRGTLDAIQREDRAWLARTLTSTAGRELTEDDLLAAYRQFLWRSAEPMWSRVRNAFEAGNWRIEDNGGSGAIILETGGALGTLRLELTKVDNTWHYAGV